MCGSYPYMQNLDSRQIRKFRWARRMVHLDRYPIILNQFQFSFISFLQLASSKYLHSACHDRCLHRRSRFP